MNRWARVGPTAATSETRTIATSTTQNGRTTTGQGNASVSRFTPGRGE